jgi:hypothetical protein
MTCGDGGGDDGGLKPVDEYWWADELTALRIDTFQRVMIAMKARGFKGIAMGTMIMLYAQKSLRRLVRSVEHTTTTHSTLALLPRA